VNVNVVVHLSQWHNRHGLLLSVCQTKSKSTMKIQLVWLTQSSASSEPKSSWLIVILYEKVRLLVLVTGFQECMAMTRHALQTMKCHVCTKVIYGHAFTIKCKETSARFSELWLNLSIYFQQDLEKRRSKQWPPANNAVWAKWCWVDYLMCRNHWRELRFL